MLALIMALIPLAHAGDSCHSFKQVFRESGCCGTPSKSTEYQIVPKPENRLFTNNYCAGQKPIDGAAPGDGYFNNINCTLEDGVVQALEQAGTNVTAGYVGGMQANGQPITTTYLEAGLCPVNVHWHLGTEHYSMGQYDEHGHGPTEGAHGRRLSENARLGFRCHHYDDTDSRFTTEYNWQHCQGLHVGETHEIHWPHSAAGACGSPYQYQTPFYDGVFCKDGIISLNPLNTFSKIGVQAQVFTLINDEDYYYPNLINGMIVDEQFGAEIVKYTGSTTGTSRNNEICSQYTPITWQVDRKCHLISASSFDKMCADMMQQADDMSGDLMAHGARELVSNDLAADNHHHRL